MSPTHFTTSTHDVLAGFDENPANKLFMDLVCFHRGLEGDEIDVQHLIKLVRNGLDYTLPMEPGVPLNTLLQGTGNFWKKEGRTWVVMTDTEARDYVAALPVPQASKEKIKEFMTNRKTIAVGAEAKPTIDDVKLVISGNSSSGFGSNQVFLDIVSDVLGENKEVHPGCPTGVRIDVAVEVLKRLDAKNVRFFVKTGRDKWRALDQIETIEFVLFHIFEKIKVFHNPPSAESVLENVPVVPTGNVVLPEDFSLPGTIPIDTPSKYDVLFGRGGMTNNHVGNRRFRDIISLHRPDCKLLMNSSLQGFPQNRQCLVRV
jgi:hypothetical protein